MKIFFVLTLLIFLPIQSYAADPCASENLEAETATTYQDLLNSDEGIQMLDDMLKRIDAGEITAEEAKKELREKVALNTRKKHDCGVSYSIKDKLKAVEAQEKAEKEALANACPADLYSIKARALYEVQKKDPAYPAFEKQIYDQVTKDTPDEMVKIFDAQWQNPDIRKKVAIAAFDMSLRQQDGCSNATLPVSEVILEVLEE